MIQVQILAGMYVLVLPVSQAVLFFGITPICTYWLTALNSAQQQITKCETLLGVQSHLEVSFRFVPVIKNGHDCSIQPQSALSILTVSPDRTVLLQEQPSMTQRWFLPSFHVLDWTYFIPDGTSLSVQTHLGRFLVSSISVDLVHRVSWWCQQKCWSVEEVLCSCICSVQHLCLPPTWIWTSRFFGQSIQDQDTGKSQCYNRKQSKRRVRFTQLC